MSYNQSTSNKDDIEPQIAGMVPITINYFACVVQRSSWPQTGVAALVSGMVCQGMPNRMGDKDSIQNT